MIYVFSSSAVLVAKLRWFTVVSFGKLHVNVVNRCCGILGESGERWSRLSERVFRRCLNELDAWRHGSCCICSKTRCDSSIGKFAFKAIRTFRSWDLKMAGIFLVEFGQNRWGWKWMQNLLWNYISCFRLQRWRGFFEELRMLLVSSTCWSTFHGFLVFPYGFH